MSDEDGPGEGNGGDVLVFPDRRSEIRRTKDVADEWLRMVLAQMDRRLTAIEQGQHFRDLERRILNLEKSEERTSTQVTSWRAQLGLILFTLTTGSGVTLAILKLLGKL